MPANTPSIRIPNRLGYKTGMAGIRRLMTGVPTRANPCQGPLSRKSTRIGSPFSRRTRKRISQQLLEGTGQIAHGAGADRCGSRRPRRARHPQAGAHRQRDPVAPGRGLLGRAAIQFLRGCRSWKPIFIQSPDLADDLGISRSWSQASTPSSTWAGVIMPGTTLLTAGWARMNLSAACESVVVASPIKALIASTFRRSCRNCSRGQVLRYRPPQNQYSGSAVRKASPKRAVGERSSPRLAPELQP